MLVRDCRISGSSAFVFRRASSGLVTETIGQEWGVCSSPALTSEFVNKYKCLNSWRPSETPNCFFHQSWWCPSKNESACHYKLNVKVQPQSVILPHTGAERPEKPENLTQFETSERIAVIIIIQYWHSLWMSSNTYLRWNSTCIQMIQITYKHSNSQSRSHVEMFSENISSNFKVIKKVVYTTEKWIKTLKPN